MAGESITADFQVQLGMLLLGPGTPYEVTKATGFLDLPAIRGDDPERPRAHGSFTGPDYAGPRVFEVELDVVATASTTFADAVAALQTACVPQAGTLDLAWRLPGRGVLTAAVKVRKSSINVDRGFQLGIAEQVALQLLAADPLAYSGQLTAMTTPPSGSGGLTWPLAFPLDYGAVGSTGRVAMANPGTADTPPVLSVAGPLGAGFEVTVVETGEKLRYEQPVDATSVVVLDCASGHAVLDGSGYRDDALSVADWFVVPALTTRTVQFSPLGSFTAPGGALRQNLALNPSVETNATGWGGVAGTGGTGSGARSTATAGWAGVAFYRYSWTVATTAVSGGVYCGFLAAVTAGTTYTASVYARPSVAQTLRLSIDWKDAGSVLLSTTNGTPTAVTANAWGRLSVSGTAPANAVSATVTCYATTGGVNWANGDTLDADALLVEATSALGAYFDGDTTDDTTGTYAWDGTAHASTSTATPLVSASLTALWAPAYW